MRLAILAMFALLFGTMTASAVPITSSTSSFVTFRDCVTLGDTVCDAISPTVSSVAGGNPGDLSATATQSIPSYGSTTGTATLTGVGEATLTGSVTSVAATRNSSNTYALQRYTNAAATGITLTFAGVLTYEQLVPAENASFTPGSAGTSTITVGGLQIFSLSDSFLDAGVTAFDNFIALNSDVFAAPGFTSLGDISASSLENLSDSGSQAMSLSVNLAANESVWLYASMQTPVANGATIDANLVTSITVPEPGSLALLGLGLMGLGVRRSLRRA